MFEKYKVITALINGLRQPSKMTVMRIKTLSIVILLVEQLMVCESRSCSWSKKTAEKVDSCPESKDELEKRANIKECGFLAVIQNCTEPAKFQYHCLIDEAEQIFIEVCVPLYNILLGYCAEYNTIGALVQQHRDLKCSAMDPACPQLYKSTDAYLYKGCYEIVKRKRQTTSSDNILELSTQITTSGINTNSSAENINTVKHSNNNKVTAVIVAVVLTLLVVAVAIFMLVRYKIHRRKWRFLIGCCRKGPEENNQLEEKDSMLKRKGDDKHSTLYDTSQMPLDESIEMITAEEIELPDRKSTFSPSKEFETNTLSAETLDSSPEKENEEQTSNENRKDSVCNIEEYREEIERAKLLRDTVDVKDKEMAAHFERQKEETRHFLNSYKDVCKYFVKTRLVEKCQNSLCKNGITILSGQQGSGKTLAAVYIMSTSRTYEKWTKIKFTSWVDLLTLKLEANTLVYIDNLFDGHMYPEELRKWCCSLCYFYFEKIQSKNDIHLLITAKTDAMKEASEQIEANINENMFYLKAESCPLSDDERKQILISQFELAEQLKEIQNPEIDSTYAAIKEKDNFCAIGFPLRAHLYAFETNPIYKTKDIFTDPASYVIRHFEREIEKDRDTGVKTLFLFLLFYTSPNSLKPSKRLDLRYGEDVREYLEDPKVVPENLLKEIGPLNFENLLTVAESLKYTILLKQSTMFEFKHQIYLHGASAYFFRKYPEAAVRYFPLDIIRPYAFPDVSPNVWSDLIQRFKKELQENKQNNGTEKEIEFPRMLEVLSCKIFDTVQFEEKFGDEFKQGTTLNWLLFTKELRFPFWAKRYGRKILSDTALHMVKEHFDFQFYQDLYGECCKIDKKYGADSGAYLDLKRLKERVWKFKTTDKKSILHLVISSDRSDYDTHLILEKMLKDTSEQDFLLIDDLLKCTSEHRICSRILCMLELLRKQNEWLTGHKPLDVSNLIAQLKISKDYNAHLELEFLVRICIVLANCEEPIKKVNTEYNSIDKRFRHVRNLLDLDRNENAQSRMTKTIKGCLAECQTSVLTLSEPKNIPFTAMISLELKQAIYDSVRVLSGKKFILKK